MGAKALRSGSLVAIEAAGVLVPAACACCGAASARSDVARLANSEQEVIVGYCDACRAHQGSVRARRAAAALASGLLGISLGLLLSLSARPPPTPAVAAIAFAAALVPPLVVGLWPRRVPAGHAALGPAVRFVAFRQLLCADDRWAKELASLNGTTCRLAAFREPRWSAAMLALPFVAPLLALAALNATSPGVRIVNLSGERLIVEVDGTSRATLEPTSVESPAAGTDLRISAGEHELVARAPDGRVLERARVVVRSGRAHLFAPASDGHCFWLETVGYGRSGARSAERVRLEGPPRFWSLPRDLGAWFSAPPDAALAETRWTGGTVTVLRQAPCEILDMP